MPLMIIILRLSCNVMAYGMQLQAAKFSEGVSPMQMSRLRFAPVKFGQRLNENLVMAQNIKGVFCAWH